MVKLSLVVLSSLAAAVSAATEVVHLTKDTFKDFVAKEPLTLVALKPEFEKAAATLKTDSIKLVNVDCPENEALCSEYGVQGFPTIKIFRHDKPADYKGGRDHDGIVSVMKRQALPALSILEADKVDAFADSDKVVLIGLFDKDSKQETEFKAVAEELRDSFTFGLTNSAEALSKHNVKAPALLLFKKFDEKLNTFAGAEFTKDEIKKFITENSMPSMDDIGPDNYENYMKLNLPILYLFVSSDEDRNTVGPEVSALAKDYKGKVSFVYIDASKYGAHAETLNLKSEWPALGLADVAKNTKFPYDQTKKIAKADVKAWLDSFVAGKLEPSLKSEPIPESDDGAVKVVVGKNYKDIIGDKTKDVFVEFYAPWCGHCKKLAPIWKDLADSLVGKNIVIAKMDSTANDLPPDAGFAIQGFPTLKLFKAKTGQMIDYEAGDRSLESLVEFLQKNAEFGSEVAAVPKTDKKAAGKEGSEEKPAEEEPTEGDEEHDEL